MRQLSSDQLQVNQGSLYPALYRLEDKGWIESEWAESPGTRPVKVYSLTAKGKRAFAAEQSSWRTFASAVEQVLQAT